MTDRIDTVLTQQTICDDCGRWIDHDAAHWTDDGASYCTSCRAIYACDRIDTAAEREKLDALDGHTPGPWSCSRPDMMSFDMDGDQVSFLYVDEGPRVEFSTTNPVEDARLSAAAPDLLATVNRLLDALDAKDAEIERLRGALEFYADNKNWNDGKWENDQPNTLTLVPSSATRDRGRVALAALSGEGQP